MLCVNSCGVINILSIPSVPAVYQLTHCQENVLDLQWLESSEMSPDEMEAIARNMATYLRHVLDQRDTHLEVLMHVYFKLIQMLIWHEIMFYTIIWSCHL